jgi:hypothetical protein
MQQTAGGRCCHGGDGLRQHGSYCHLARQLVVIIMVSLTRLLVMIPLAAIVASAAFAPRIEVYTALACKVHRPEYFVTEATHPSSVERQNLDLKSFPRSSFDSPDAVDRLYLDDVGSLSLFQGGSKRDLNPCASDPVVQAAVAKLSLGEHRTLPFFTHDHMNFGGNYC